MHCCVVVFGGREFSEGATKSSFLQKNARGAHNTQTLMILSFKTTICWSVEMAYPKYLCLYLFDYAINVLFYFAYRRLLPTSASTRTTYYVVLSDTASVCC